MGGAGSGRYVTRPTETVKTVTTTTTTARKPIDPHDPLKTFEALSLQKDLLPTGWVTQAFETPINRIEVLKFIQGKWRHFGSLRDDTPNWDKTRPIEAYLYTFGAGEYRLRAVYREMVRGEIDVKVGTPVDDDDGGREKSPLDQMDRELLAVTRRLGAMASLKTMKQLVGGEDNAGPVREGGEEEMKASDVVEIVKAMKGDGEGPVHTVQLLQVFQAEVAELRKQNTDLMLKLVEGRQQNHPVWEGIMRLFSEKATPELLEKVMTGSVVAPTPEDTGWFASLGKFLNQAGPVIQPLVQTLSQAIQAQLKQSIGGVSSAPALPSGTPSLPQPENAVSQFFDSVLDELLVAYQAQPEEREEKWSALTTMMAVAPGDLLARVHGLGAMPVHLARSTVRLLEPRFADDRHWPATWLFVQHLKEREHDGPDSAQNPGNLAESEGED